MPGCVAHTTITPHGYSAAMGRSSLLVAAAAALLVALLAWPLLHAPVVAPPAAPTHGEDHAPGPPTGATTTQGANGPTAPAPRLDAAPPAAASQGVPLRVRLRGLHPAAPWTAPLRLDLDGRDGDGASLEHDAAGTPDGDGVVTFQVPGWIATATAQQGRLTARDDHYQDVARHWRGPPDTTQELLVDVQVVATLLGRVVDGRGQPVEAARVTAYAHRDGQPAGGAVGRTNSGPDGTFRLMAPPDTTTFVLVAPMRASRRADTGDLRDDLLPTGLVTTTTVGQPRQLGDLVLAQAAQLSGTVQWQDGGVIPFARVRVLPQAGQRFTLDERAVVQRLADGRLAPLAAIDAGDDGRFTLPALAGAAVEVAVTQLPTARLLGSFTLPAVAPQQLSFVLPRALRLRATDGGRAVPHARLQIADWEIVGSDASGVFELVTTRALQVRASHRQLRSPWLDVPASAAGTTVDLAMTAARTEVSVEFDGDFRVRNTVITWRRDDGQDGREHLLRDDRGGPFQLFLDPGRYTLTAGPGGGERNGVFLLPQSRDVEVGLDPIALRLPAVFGGSFTVMATDGAGTWLGGDSRLFDPHGADLSAPFRVRDATDGRAGRPGELLADGVNVFTGILPPGEYELVGDFGSHGAQRQRFTIKPREVTEVRLRLP